MSPGAASFGSIQNPMGQFGNIGLNVGLDGQAQGIPRGHGRRHSVNVVNKTASQPNPGTGFDGFDDGFLPPGVGGHSRQASRVDSSWRISK